MKKDAGVFCGGVGGGAGEKRRAIVGEGGGEDGERRGGELEGGGVEGGGAFPPGIFSGKGKFGGKREKKNVKLLLLLIVMVEY